VLRDRLAVKEKPATEKRERRVFTPTGWCAHAATLALPSRITPGCCEVKHKLKEMKKP